MSNTVRKPAPPKTDPQAKRAILALAREALFAVPAGKISGGVDWKAVFQESRAQHLVALLSDGAQKQELPADVKQQWKAEADRMLLYNVHSQMWHTRVQKEMDKAGIPCVVIKGLASASYYPRPILRGAGDVDVLVRKEDMEAGGRVLRGLGLRPGKDATRHEAHVAYYKPGVDVELHWWVSGTPAGERGRVIQDAFADLHAASVPYTCESGTCRIPSVLHHAMILLIHTAKHLVGSGTALRHLCDWAVFAHRVGEDVFENELRAPLKEMGLWQLAQIFTDLSCQHLGLPQQRWAGVTDRKYADDLLDDFFASGYFGRKDRTRGYESLWYIDINTRSTAGSAKMRNLIRRINTYTRKQMPVTARVPLLLPAGWVYFVGRYLLRVRKGLRPRFHLSGIKNAGKRSELYTAWRLFEPEEET